jgi:dihydrofolate reductase
MIRAILACDDHWGIGRDGDLPWPHNSDDLKWFKANTTDSTVVMGKATWDSLPVKPLPKRTNIVVTSSNSGVTGSFIYVSFDKAEKFIVDQNRTDNIWIIGGAKLVDGLLHIIDEIWLSRIDGDYNCDTVLPKDRITDEFAINDMTVDETMTIEKWVRR